MQKQIDRDHTITLRASKRFIRAIPGDTLDIRVRSLGIAAVARAAGVGRMHLRLFIMGECGMNSEKHAALMGALDRLEVNGGAK